MLVAGGVLHLFVLCVPAVAVAGIARLATDPRIGLFLLLVIGWGTLEAAAQPARRARPRTVRGPRWLGRAIGAVLLLAFWSSLVERALSARGQFDVLAVGGVVVMLTGVGLRLQAIRTLGYHFLDEVGLATAHPLVTHSLYGRIRHPAEAGTLWIAAGGAAVLGSGAGFVVCLALLTLVLWRIRIEDALLGERHGPAFAAYARDVRALVPLPAPRREAVAE